MRYRTENGAGSSRGIGMRNERKLGCDVGKVLHLTLLCGRFFSQGKG